LAGCRDSHHAAFDLVFGNLSTWSGIALKE
jgi:hypothetical protein